MNNNHILQTKPNNYTMKKTITTSFVAMLISIVTWAQTPNVVWETSYIDPKTDQMMDLQKAMKAHNNKFHATTPYRASVWQVTTGKRTGHLLWVMGPFTWADLDKRPSGDDHTSDWAGNVMPKTNGMKDGYYWEGVEGFNYRPSEDFMPKIMQVRSFDLKRGKWDEFKHVLSMVMKVYQEKKLGHSIALYDNVVPDGDLDAIIVWQYENYAYWDKDLNFQKAFEEIHGDNSWFQFLEALDDIIDDTDDELLEVIPDMSAD